MDEAITVNAIMCEKCGKRMKPENGYSSTYVGYISPKGHDHDDNCKVKIYRCECGEDQWRAEEFQLFVGPCSIHGGGTIDG